MLVFELVLTVVVDVDDEEAVRATAIVTPVSALPLCAIMTNSQYEPLRSLGSL